MAASKTKSISTNDKQVVIYRPRTEVGRINLVPGDGRLVDILHEVVEVTFGHNSAIGYEAIGNGMHVTDAYEVDLVGHRFTFGVKPLDEVER